MRKTKLATYAVALTLAAAAITGISTETAHAEEAVQAVATDTDAAETTEAPATEETTEAVIEDVAADEVTVADGGNEYYNININGGTWDGTHYTVDGNVIINAFFCDGTYTYYLQADGTPMKDRLTYHPDGKHVIYFDANGHEVFSNFANVKQSVSGEPVDDNCFFDTYGYMYVNKLTYDKSGEKLYYINEYGVIEQKGWFQFPDRIEGINAQTQDMDGRYGYGNADGTLMTNQWTYNWNDQLVYLQGDGSMATGVLYVDGTYNYFDANDGHFVQKYDTVDENYITTRYMSDGGSVISEYDVDNRLVRRDKYNYMNMCVNHKEYIYDEDGKNKSMFERYYDYATGNYYEVTTTYTYDKQGRLIDELQMTSLSQIENKYKYYDSGRVAYMSYEWKMNGYYADYTETFYNDDPDHTISVKKMYNVAGCKEFTPFNIQEDYYEEGRIVKSVAVAYDENQKQIDRTECVYEYTDTAVIKTTKRYDADNNYMGKSISVYDKEQKCESTIFYDKDGNVI